MTATMAPESPGSRGLRAKRFVERVLDELEVTERAYHHLNFSLPLAADLVRRARRAAEPGASVLVIGGSTLLAESLVRLGFKLELWQFPGAYLTDAMKPLASRQVSTQALGSLDFEGKQFDLIIVPLVLESLVEPLEPFLRGLRSALTHEGTLIIATTNQARLDTRLSVVGGRAIKPKAEVSAVSLSWPALHTFHEYHAEELKVASQVAGFRIRACDYVVSERAFLEMEPLNAFDYARRKLRGAVMNGLPGVRDVIVMELSARVGESIKVKTKEPFVSVLVAVRQGGDGLRETIGALALQSYPKHLYEIVVLHDGALPGVAAIVAEAAAQTTVEIREFLHPEAAEPEARNRAMVESRSDITAHTDDQSYIPGDWLRAAIAWFDADTVAVSGPVFLKGASESRFLSMPTTRPDPDEKGVPPQGLFPICNVFLRTPVVTAAGGFDRSLAHEDDQPGFGWDTELAWRLHRSGWRIRFREEVYLFRVFPGENDRGWVRSHFHRAAAVPALMAAAPEYASKTLATGVFASKQTMYFDLAVAGVLMAARHRRWPWLLATLPWLAMVSHHVDAWPPQRWPDSARSAGRLAARQTVWLAGLLKGSAKARRFVL